MTVIHKLIIYSLLQAGQTHFLFNFQIDRSGRIPMLRFRDRESYSGNRTKEYDDIAMKYLTYVLLFLVACSSIYSLKYEQHKSWYSWVLGSFTSCVYMFGKLLICSLLLILRIHILYNALLSIYLSGDICLFYCMLLQVLS